MKNMSELQREIELVRAELDESILQNDEFDVYYQKSRKLDKLIEQYIDESENN